MFVDKKTENGGRMGIDGSYQRCRRDKGRRSKIAGFTLLELMTVIVILGIVAALLVPVIARVRAKAQQTKCMSNLRQLGVALNAYVADHQEYPLYAIKKYDKAAERKRLITWERMLTSITLPDEDLDASDWSKGVLGCPAAKQPRVFRVEGIGYVNYGYNATGHGGQKFARFVGLGGQGRGDDKNWHTRYPPPVKSGGVVNPSSMIALGDGFRGCGNAIEDGTSILGREAVDRYPQYVYADAWRRMKRRHGGEVDIIFVDGHVEPVPLEKLMIDRSDSALSMWNRDGQPHRERLCSK